MSKCLGSSAEDKTLILRNADKTLRLGRWIKVQGVNHSSAISALTATYNGAPSSAGIFSQSTMTQSRTNALAAGLGAFASHPLLNWAFFVDWNEMRWQYTNDGWVWEIPPIISTKTYCETRVSCYRFPIPNISGETVTRAEIEVANIGNGYGQTIDLPYIAPDGWVYHNPTQGPTAPIASNIRWDFIFSQSNPTTANSGTLGATAYANDGNYKYSQLGTPFVWDGTYAYWSDPSNAGALRLSVSSGIASSMPSNANIYVVVRPLLVYGGIIGPVNWFGGSLNPNAQSAFNFFNNRTVGYAQNAMCGITPPVLWIYAH